MDSDTGAGDAARVAAVRSVLMEQALCMLQLHDMGTMDALVSAVIASSAVNSLLILIVDTGDKGTMLYAKVKTG